MASIRLFRIALLTAILAAFSTLNPLQSALKPAWCESPANPGYPWLEAHGKPHNPNETIYTRFAAPDDAARVAVTHGSFAYWLRNLPLKPGNPPVLYHTGQPKARQDLHAAVIDLDVGERDLQQCADAIIRLRAEYLYALSRFDEIRFNATSGDPIDLNRWARGDRPRAEGNAIRWRSAAAAPSRAYPSFREYLDFVFIYAGTISLQQEMRPVEPTDPPRIGDVFIRGGSPGHAIIVADAAVNPRSGETYMLLAQSFFPAQDMHILVNQNIPFISPWYLYEHHSPLQTPEWTFRPNERRRFQGDN